MIHRAQRITAADFLHFVELNEFADDWKRLGLTVEDDLWALQMSIMSGPKFSPVIQGTGGLRKLRFSPMGWKRGKSGSVRVCYAYFEAHATVLLMMAYGKGRKESLTAVEVSGIKRYLELTENWLSKRSRKRKT